MWLLTSDMRIFKLKTVFVFVTIIIYMVNSHITDEEVYDDELIFLQVISRHGARTPLNTFPTDPYAHGFWKQMPGQLTEYGIFQTHELGQYLRQRYIEGQPFTLLSQSYNSQEIYVRSSDVDRTLMSASSCMTGLYPPNNSIPNPIPVHTVPQSDDKILFDVQCPLREKILEELKHSDEVESTRLANVDGFRLLEKYSGQNIDSFDIVAHIADNLICVSTNNMTLPEWTKYTMKNMTMLEFVYKMFDFNTNIKFDRRNQSRLIAGQLLKLLSDNISKKIAINSTSSPTKAIFYFTHDSIVTPLLSAMGIFNGKAPPFTASIIMELYKNNNTKISDGFKIQILYRNSSQESPHVLQIPGCQEKCPLSQFIELTKHNFILDWKMECLEEEPIKNRDYLVFALAVACVVFLIISLASVAFAIVRYRSTSVYRNYVDVPTEIE